jgi:phenylalanyl-tRNA synthetase beta chain
MKISYNWLKQYLDTDISCQEIIEILTQIGLEVESSEKHESIKGGLEGLVVGEVLTCAQHPNADKLSVTTVNVGQPEILNIVCGAPNVRAGQKVIVATIGTTLYSGEEPFKIKKGKIRGEVSEGMICAEDEIGLGTDHAGIIVLDASAKVGTAAKDYFKIEDDYLIEVAILPNRSDAASHLGVARDLVAYLQQNGNASIVKPSVDNFKIDNTSNIIGIEVLDAEACPRYTGLTITGVEVKPSPEWLQNRLKAIGQKPINNVVDVTNFVLHELGQPLHAFDADEITGKKVIVRTLPQDTPFITLDGTERKLSSDDLMICNSETGMCIGGVFGGLKSGVSDKTKTVFLESAYFNPRYIRRTSKRHGINTDASFRFERGTDPNITVYALKRAAMLIKEIAGGEITSEIIDIYPEPVKDFEINLFYHNVTRLIGKEIPKETIKNILTSLEVKIINETESSLFLQVPPYRVDVQREADVIEDILRIYGYNNVEIPNEVRSTLSYQPKPDNEKLKETIANQLSSLGFNEAWSNSLTKSAYYENGETFKAENSVKILNPLSSDLDIMRQTLLFGGLEAVLLNQNFKNTDLKLYEFGNCYKYNNFESVKNVLDQYSESSHLALFLTGNKTQINWNLKESPTSFFELKAHVDNILTKLNINVDKLTIEEFKNDLFAYAVSYSLNKKVIVEFGSISKKILKSFDIDNEVFYADIQWQTAIKYYSPKISFVPMSKFPEVKRDLALLIDKNVSFAQLKAVAEKTERKLLKRVSIFDVYEGERIESGKKSYALSFILQDETKTLTDQQIDRIMSNLIKNYETELNAKLR